MQYFKILYQKLDYAAAARAIPISYQGLKRSMQSFEENLGIHLFDIGERDCLKPTPYADLLYGTAQKWIDDAHALERAFGSLRNSGKRMIALGVATGAQHSLSRLEKFESFHDDIALDVIEYPDCIVDEMLGNGVVDLAITAEPFDLSFTTIPLVRFRSCVWVRNDHRLANCNCVSLSDLQGEDLMFPDSHYRTGEYMLRTFSERGIEPRSVSYCTDMLSPFMFAVRGKGVGIGLWEVAQGLTSIGSVKAILLDDGISNAFGLSYRKDHEITSDEQALIDFLIPESGLSGIAL